VQPVVFAGQEEGLQDGEEGGEDGVVGEEQVLQFYLAGGCSAAEVAVGIVESVEDEAGEIEGHEIKVHAFYAS
jgi:hypothetical protein